MPTPGVGEYIKLIRRVGISLFLGCAHSIRLVACSVRGFLYSVESPDYRFVLNVESSQSTSPERPVHPQHVLIHPIWLRLRELVFSDHQPTFVLVSRVKHLLRGCEAEWQRVVSRIRSIHRRSGEKYSRACLSSGQKPRSLSCWSGWSTLASTTSAGAYPWVIAGSLAKCCPTTAASSSDGNAPGRVRVSMGRCVTGSELGSVEALSGWLKERLASTGRSTHLQSWGVASGTKALANLWSELVDGETTLEDARPPKRTVHVVSVHIKNGAGKFLLEAGQEMSDGRVRERNRPLSEKMKAGEGVEDACLRGIREELGCEMGAADKVVMLKDSHKEQEVERESLSYPGLMTRYVIHTMVALMNDLPNSDFVTLEEESKASSDGASAPGQSGEMAAAVGVSKHFWKWVSHPPATT